MDNVGLTLEQKEILLWLRNEGGRAEFKKASPMMWFGLDILGLIQIVDGVVSITRAGASFDLSPSIGR